MSLAPGGTHGEVDHTDVKSGERNSHRKDFLGVKVEDYFHGWGMFPLQELNECLYTDNF